MTDSGVPFDSTDATVPGDGLDFSRQVDEMIASLRDDDEWKHDDPPIQTVDGKHIVSVPVGDAGDNVHLVVTTNDGATVATAELDLLPAAELIGALILRLDRCLVRNPPADVDELSEAIQILDLRIHHARALVCRSLFAIDSPLVEGEDGEQSG